MKRYNQLTERVKAHVFVRLLIPTGNIEISGHISSEEIFPNARLACTTSSKFFIFFYQTKPTKPNLPNQTYQTKPTKPNLPNQTYQTKPTKPTKPIKLNLPSQAKPSKPYLPIQNYQTKLANRTHQQNQSNLS